MFPKSLTIIFRFLVACPLLWAASLLPAHPQEESADPVTNIEVDVYDEIIVHGEPTLRLLRDEVYEAEDDFYDLFNSLNDGKQFDISCFYRVQVGSQIRRRICEANFIRREYRPPTAVGGFAFQAYVRHKTRKLYEIMGGLMEEHPNLYVALTEYYDAKQTYVSAVRDRCFNSGINCGRND